MINQYFLLIKKGKELNCYNLNNEKVDINLNGINIDKILNDNANKFLLIKYKKNKYIISNIKTKTGLNNLLKNVKGIGKKTIEKILNYYKENNFHILYLFLNDLLNEKLLLNKIINKKQNENLINYFNEYYKQLNLEEEEFVKENNLTSSFVSKLKRHKLDIIDILLKDPYKIAFNINGIGFKTIDKIAKNINKKYFIIDEEEFKKQRLKSAIFYSLKEGEKEGHVFLTKKGIEHYLKTKLGIKEEIVDNEFTKIINELQKEKKIVITKFKNTEQEIIYLYKNYILEENTANLIKERLKFNNKTINIKNIIEPETFNLSEKQKEAITASLKNNIIIITGGPGTGKTTVAKYIYKNLINYFPDKKIKIMAPTGTAAKRIGNVIGTKATTIHIGLQWKKGQFLYNEENKLDADIVIIDESSMIDLPLFYHLLSALKKETKLILIGDADQLPPVGIGKPFEDLLKSKIVPFVKLDKVYRQSNENPIAYFAEEVNNGNTDGEWKYKYVYRNVNFYKQLNIIIKRNYLKNNNEYYIENMTEDLIETFYHIYKEKKVDINDIQILSVLNKGKGSVEYINKEIQELINKNNFIQNTKFKVGDKVIQTFNNYKINVMNGEIGVIESFNNNTITVKFLEGSLFKRIEYSLDKKEDNYINKNLTLSYAITIHKSQGNEWKYVLILLNNYFMLNRKLLYTAITRSKEQVFLFTNYMYLMKGINTPYGITSIIIDGKEKLVKINRNSLLYYKIIKE